MSWLNQISFYHLGEERRRTRHKSDSVVAPAPGKWFDDWRNHIETGLVQRLFSRHWPQARPDNGKLDDNTLLLSLCFIQTSNDGDTRQSQALLQKAWLLDAKSGSSKNHQLRSRQSLVRQQTTIQQQTTIPTQFWDCDKFDVNRIDPMLFNTHQEKKPDKSLSRWVEPFSAVHKFVYLDNQISHYLPHHWSNWTQN